MEKLLALEASAGSGKTFSLSVRYICLLFQGANPASIVALTFTKKAANEMKERIFKTLLELESKSAELDEICKTLEKSEQQILSARPKVLKRFLNSPLHIETIDAFYGKILRKFSLNLGIMPDFTSTDASDNEKLEELFINTVKSDPQQFYSLIKFMTSQDKKLQNIFDTFTLLYEKSEELKNEYKKSGFPTETKILAKANEIALCLEDSGAPERTVNSFRVDSLDALLGKSFWKLEVLNNRTYAKYQTDALDTLYEELKRLYFVYCQEKQSYLLGEFFTLFETYKKSKFTLAKRENELTFSDITLFTHRLLHHEISKEFLYFRLDGAIEHLLIDEFQDTNVVQFDILRPIVEEIKSGVGVKDERSFFYVGDTKQSIYRFRGGTKELFEAVAKEFYVQVKALDVNYRSSEVVVNYVNEIFGKVYANYTPQKVFSEHKNRGFVGVYTCEDMFEELFEKLEFLFKNGVISDDIAILCHTNSDAADIKQAIKTWRSELKVSIESTVKLIHTNAIREIVEFLKYSYFGFDINGANVLALQGKDFREKLDAKIVNFNKNLEMIIYECIEILGLNGTNKDILRFIEIAKGYENIESFLFELESFNDPSVDSEDMGIKVLTIHKSKGLEFKNVILLDRLKAPRHESGTFIFEYEKEKLQNIHVRMKNREFVDSVYKEAKEKNDALSVADKKNAFYVAFTRARENLLVIKKQKSSAMEFLNLSDFEKGTVTPSSKPPLKEPLHEFKLPLSYGKQEIVHEENEAEYDINAIYFGTALHYLLEIARDFSKESLERAHVGVKNLYGEMVDADEILKRALLLSQNEEFLKLTNGGVLKKEQPLMYEGKRKQLDLLVEKEDKLIIIDYKSSARVYEEHKMQVSEYKNALLNIQKKEVEAYLVYLRNEQIEIINL